jgi:hypothetical protein
MTTATVREAIHERLDPVIEEIVAREISQRGGYAGGLLGQEPGRAFEALMPVLLSTLIQRRQVGQEPGRVLEAILPILPALLPALLQQQRRPGGLQEPERILQNILPILPVLLPAIMQQQRRPGGQEPGRVLEAILPILPALLPAIMQRGQAGQIGQANPLQTLAPVLVAALSAC